MKHLSIIIILIIFLVSCNQGQTTSSIKSEIKTETVKMLYYNEAFSFDTTSNIRLDGFYQVRQIFGSYTTNGTDYYPHDPTYGYLQFFKDGFCKVGWWNGFFESSSEIENEIANNKAFGFWGTYKINGDTLHLEYLYNPASPGVEPFETRNILVGLIKENEILVTLHDNIKYSFPVVAKDSLISSCIGKFVNIQTNYDIMDNYLKKNISNYK